MSDLDRAIAAAQSVPFPRTPGDNATREWALTFLSRFAGREITGGWAVDTLVTKLEER